MAMPYPSSGVTFTVVVCQYATAQPFAMGHQPQLCLGIPRLSGHCLSSYKPDQELSAHVTLKCSPETQ